MFKTVNDRNKLVRTLALAKSAIGHNMATDLPNMTTPTALVWGNQDIVTPPTRIIKYFFEALNPKTLQKSLTT